MKNITLSADAELIEQARLLARQQRTTLNAMFRQWLKEWVDRHAAPADYDAMMKRFSYARPGRKFTREEMNER